jgi:hypothetical protein
MCSTTFIRLAASTIIAVGGTALARPALASARTACDPRSVDNISSSAEDYCSAQGFDSARVSISCAGGQVTGVTVTCFNYYN